MEKGYNHNILICSSHQDSTYTGIFHDSNGMSELWARTEEISNLPEPARKRAIYEILTQALVDSLTEIPNRRALEQRLEETMADCRRNPGGHYALVFFDLKGFKTINDTHGHEVGDEALRLFAGRVRFIKRKEEFFARLGGDEFVLILKGDDFTGAQDRLEKQLRNLNLTLLDSSQQPFDVPIIASIGVRPIDNPHQNAAYYIKEAEKNMYAHKQRSPLPVPANDLGSYSPAAAIN